MNSPEPKTPDDLVCEFVEIGCMLNGAAVLLHRSEAVHGDDDASSGLCLLNRAIRELDATRDAAEQAFNRMQAGEQESNGANPPSCDSAA